MIVVTGGAGFIGSNIVAALEDRGDHHLAVCDKLEDGDKWQNIGKRDLAHIIAPEKLFDFLEENNSNIDAIIHMAAISSTTASDVDLILETNVRLSLRLWQWCTQHHVRFIYASSAATYGNGQQGFADDESLEALSKLKPMNPYGWSKHFFDRRVLRMVTEGGVHPPQWAGLKFFNVYGPNEEHKGPQRSVVSQIFPNVRNAGTVSLFKSHHPDYPDGGQMRDFIWVGDCVDVVLWLLDNPEVSGLFNCGTGKARTFADLAGAVFAALEQEPKITYRPTPENIRDHYQYFTEADTNRLRAAGYQKPFTSLEDGVAEYVRSYLNTDDPYR
ncbi:MAG: ADP-glyceromanno-heptose 6-epimerase [Rhodospirillaceae bacterium]|jgi:ADP-L-glycero-D-manno-heptose 6-epimerase